MIGIVTTLVSLIGPSILSRIMGGGMLDRLSGLADRWIASGNDARKLELEEFKATVEGARHEQAERAKYLALNPGFWSKVQLAFIAPLIVYWTAIVFDSTIFWWVRKHTDWLPEHWKAWNAAALPEPMMTWAGWMIGFLFLVSMWKGRR